MRISSLKLYNFRSFSNYSIEFKPGINVLFGANAIGKTSLLESIYYLSLTKSFKTNDEQVIIRDGYDCFSIKGSFQKENESFDLKTIKDNKGKTVFKNLYKFPKISDYLGESLVVSFCNNDLSDLNGSSRNRRKIFEPIFCQISKEYVVASNCYKKILNERNALLKRLMLGNNNKLLVLLDSVDEQLFEKAKIIENKRKLFVEEINKKINEYHSKLSPENDVIRIDYLPSTNYENFKEELKLRREQDVKKGTTSIGPHRDDYVFIINNKNIIDYGSQGQQRSMLISLKLCFVELLKDAKDEYPILLLDDVLSELDKNRQNNLFSLINPNVQTILSTATLSEVDESVLNKANIITLKKEM